jgi:ADP-heptose:LPS heptosyltransferase/chromosome segregation ATPase
MRIAVSNPDNIGDFVVRQPMLAALAAAGHELLLIVRTHVAPLAAWAVPGATIVQCVADPYQPQFQIDAAPDDRVVKALTAFDPDIFVVASFQHSQLEEQLAQRLPRAKAIGFGGELFQNDKSRNIAHVPAINLAVQVQVGRDWLEARKNEVLASAILGTSVTLAPPRLAAEKRFLTAAAGRLRQEGFSKRKFWIVCAGEGSAYTSLKNWSLGKWAEVCTTMVRDHGLHLVFVGTPAEHESTAAIRSQMGEFAGKTIDMTSVPDGLDMLVGLTAYSDGYLGKDTGPMHIAAALGKPVVAVFGGGHWPRFLPSPSVGKVLSMQVPCSDCNWFCPYKTSYCVKNIPVDAVQDAIRAVLTGQQTEFEVALLEPEPWVARAMVLDAAEIGRDALRTLEAERANFHQWHSDRVRDIDALRVDLTRVEADKSALALERDELSRGLSQLRDTTLQDAGVRQALQQTLATRTEELARINDHAAVIDSERMTLQRLLTQRETDLAGLTERVTISAAHAEIANKQCDSLTQTLARQTAQLAEIQPQLIARQANESTLQRLLTARDEEVVRLSALASSSSERLDAALADRSALRDANQRLELERTERAAALEAALADRATLREANQRLDQECAERAAALDAALASLDQIESRYQGTIADLRHQLRRAEDQLRSVLTLVPDLRDELSRCLAEVARIPVIEQDQAAKQSLVDQLTQSLDAIEVDHADRLVLINTLSANLAEVEADQHAKQGVIERLSANLADVEADQHAKQDVIERLAANLAEVEADQHAKQDVIERLASKLAEVEADQHAKQDVIERLAASLEAANAAIDEHLADLEFANALSEEQDARLASANAAIEDQRQRIARTESALEEQQQLVARGEATIGSLRLRIEGLQQQIAEIEADRDARLRLIERISADLAAIDADRANRGQQIDLLHAHIENQRVKIIQLEATLLPRRLVNLVKKN